MRKFSLIGLTLIALLVAACGTSDSSSDPTATPTSRANPGYVAVLEAPTGDVITPDFTLPAATGGNFTFSSVRGEKPVAVIFYRGFF